jgi:hypothetical protein
MTLKNVPNYTDFIWWAFVPQPYIVKVKKTLENSTSVKEEIIVH